MKILLIRPKPSEETIGLQHVMLVEPLELETIASTIPKEEVVIIDMILENKTIDYFINREKPDLVGVTGYITDVPTIIEYCKTAKKLNPKVITVVGGVHVEVVPEDLNNKFIDYRIIRNATIVFPKLLDYLSGKGIIPKGILKFNEDYELEKLPNFNFYYPFPNRELTERYRKEYFYIFHNKVALIKTSFGCPYKCSFCFCRKITNDNYHTRDLKDVIYELKRIKEKEIYIVDDDFLVSPNRINNFLDLLVKNNINKKYLIYARADFIVNNKEILKRFKNLGLKTVIVGFESFNDEELKKYNKGNDVKTNENAIRFLNEIKVDCYATVIIPPHWDYADFDYLVKKLKNLKIKYVNLQPLTPLPRTGFKVKNSKLIINKKEYPKWDLAHISIQPEKMSVSEFYKCIMKTYDKVIFSPYVLFGYLKYSPSMLYKLLKGSILVRKQYSKKYRESLKNA